MKKHTPDFIFETSWEVCNKVGGIYTVLSTRARTLAADYGDRLIFVGPDFWKDNESPDFNETDELAEWREFVKRSTGLNVRTGRWNICGNPVAVLVDFSTVYERKNEIYGEIWRSFGVDSLHAYGDYDESAMFGWASGTVIASYYDFFKLQDNNVCAHFHEWMTAFGLFYLKKYRPSIATLFTTHATTTGRSIAGNGKPLYDYLPWYFGDQMASELNVESKHSAEKMAARHSDCFTTVSDITDRECAQLLEKAADIVTPNGFEPDFVPKGAAKKGVRLKARERLRAVAEALFGDTLPENTRFIATSGRYEFRNKGLDLYIDVINRIARESDMPLVAYVIVPAWNRGAREDLRCRLDRRTAGATPLHAPFTTHNLVEPQHDPLLNALRSYSFTNMRHEQVKVVFVPTYLDGRDGIFNMTYYDLLCGFDLTIFPSYYEPWGYTPLESAAAGVPTVTTDLAGFGAWVAPEGSRSLTQGVGVAHRTDSNFAEVSAEIAAMAMELLTADDETRSAINAQAKKAADKAHWSKFIKYYRKAYAIAIAKRDARTGKITS